MVFDDFGWFHMVLMVFFQVGLFFHRRHLLFGHATPAVRGLRTDVDRTFAKGSGDLRSMFCLVIGGL